MLLTMPWRGQRAVSRGAAVGWSTAAAVVSCLLGLGYQPLSWDEAVTANAASRSLPALWRLVNHTDAPLAAYYLGMHGWVRLLTVVDVRPSEGWLRLPSALAGIAAVALTAALASRLFNPTVGLAAGLLVAVHPLFVFYAHDARPYTLVTLGVLVSTVALRRALRRPTALRLTLYGLSCVVVLYVHLFAIFALAAHAVIVGGYATRRWHFAAVGAAVAVVSAPLLWLGTHQTGEIGWVARPDLPSVASFLARVAGTPMLLALPLLAVPLGRALLRRPRHADPGTARNVAHSTPNRRPLLAWWALLPPAALMVVSFAQPVLVARYALAAVPAMMILLAVLLRRIGGRAATAVAVVTMLAAGGTVAYQQTRPFKYENFRAAADRVTDYAHAGDGLLFLPASFRVGYDEYLRPDREAPPVPVVTDLALQAPGQWRSDAVIGGQECDPATLVRRIDSHQRIFLVGTTLAAALQQRHSAGERAKEQILLRDYRQIWSTRYGDVTVTLLVRGS